MSGGCRHPGVAAPSQHRLDRSYVASRHAGRLHAATVCSAAARWAKFTLAPGDMFQVVAERKRMSGGANDAGYRSEHELCTPAPASGPLATAAARHAGGVARAAFDRRARGAIGARTPDRHRRGLRRRHRRRRSADRDRARPAGRRRQAGDAERAGARGADRPPRPLEGRDRSDAAGRGQRHLAGRRQRCQAAACRIRFAEERAGRARERPQGLRRAGAAPGRRAVRAIPAFADRRSRRRPGGRRRPGLGRHRLAPRAGARLRRRRPAPRDAAGSPVRQRRQPTTGGRSRVHRRRLVGSGTGPARRQARRAAPIRRRPRRAARDRGRKPRLHRCPRRVVARQPRHRQGRVRADAARRAIAAVRFIRPRADGARRARPRLGRGGMAHCRVAAEEDSVRRGERRRHGACTGRRWSATTATASPSCAPSSSPTRSSRSPTGSA